MNEINIIDAHQHFWTYDPVAYDWITDEMPQLRKNYLPDDLLPVLQKNGVDGCIAVQALQTDAETAQLLAFADEHDFIAGVVGWTDLSNPRIDEKLDGYRRFTKLAGFRHVLQAETTEFMLQPSFLNGIRKLGSGGFTYDILIYPHQLEAAARLVSQFPEQVFIIDHLAKPEIRTGEIGNWKNKMRKMGEFPSVYCKLSGMVTEADWKNWTVAELTPYMDALLEIFGTDRILFGSDWPVCLLAASYENWLTVVKDYFVGFSREEQEKIFSRNASICYNL